MRVAWGFFCGLIQGLDMKCEIRNMKLCTEQLVLSIKY